MKIINIAFVALSILCFSTLKGSAQEWIFYDPTAFALRGTTIPGELYTEALYLKVQEKKLLDKLAEQQKKMLEKQDKQGPALAYYTQLGFMTQLARHHINIIWQSINEIRSDPLYLKHGLYPIESEMKELERQYHTIARYIASLARAPHFGGEGYRITFYQDMGLKLAKINTKMHDIELKVENLKVLNEIVIRNIVH